MHPLIQENDCISISQYGTESCLLCSYAISIFNINLLVLECILSYRNIIVNGYMELTEEGGERVCACGECDGCVLGGCEDGEV